MFKNQAKPIPAIFAELSCFNFPEASRHRKAETTHLCATDLQQASINCSCSRILVGSQYESTRYKVQQSTYKNYRTCCAFTLHSTELSTLVQCICVFMVSVLGNIQYEILCFGHVYTSCIRSTAEKWVLHPRPQENSGTNKILKHCCCREHIFE